MVTCLHWSGDCADGGCGVVFAVVGVLLDGCSFVVGVVAVVVVVVVVRVFLFFFFSSCFSLSPTLFFTSMFNNYFYYHQICFYYYSDCCVLTYLWHSVPTRSRPTSW